MVRVAAKRQQLCALIAAAIVTGCQDAGSAPSTPQTTDPVPEATKKVSAPVTDKPSEAPPTSTAETASAHPSDTPAAAPADSSPFVLPPGYDEAEAGLRQKDKDLMAQAMAVLPPANYDAQAIRLIVATALGDPAAIKKERSQLDSATATSSPYSAALADLARSASASKPDWKHLDEIADGLNARKGCVLAYDALALFAGKAADSARVDRYKKMATDHAGQDG
jgi:hypothetical protein